MAGIFDSIKSIGKGLNLYKDRIHENSLSLSKRIDAGEETSLRTYTIRITNIQEKIRDGEIVKVITADMIDIESGEIHEGNKYYLSPKMTDLDGNPQNIKKGDVLDASLIFNVVYFGKLVDKNTVEERRKEQRRKTRIEEREKRRVKRNKLDAILNKQF